MVRNFLWMMYRSGWGSKENQQTVLALTLRRAFFDELLQLAVPSSWDRSRYGTEAEWADAVNRSSVRLQWDPDHHPSGVKLERRAIQLGLRGEILRRFAHEELVTVEDVSGFVAKQRAVLDQRGISALATPREQVYRPGPSITKLLCLDADGTGGETTPPEHNGVLRRGDEGENPSTRF